MTTTTPTDTDADRLYAAWRAKVDESIATGDRAARDAAEMAGIRAVVAAYVAQQRSRGVVEVRADDLAEAVENADRLMTHYHPDVLARLDAALRGPTP